jgi:hypothetical protein
MVPTLAIIHPDLPGAKMIINEADYDPTQHQLYGEPKTRKRSPEQIPVQSKDRSPEQTPAEPQEQPPEPISDLPENLSPELTPNGPEDQPSPTPALSEAQSPEPISDEPEDQPSPTHDLSEAQPPTYSQSDLEAKNITALRAIAAENRIPRRMKLSRDELIEAVLRGVGNGE